MVRRLLSSCMNRGLVGRGGTAPVLRRYRDERGCGGEEPDRAPAPTEAPVREVAMTRDVVSGSATRLCYSPQLVRLNRSLRRGFRFSVTGRENVASAPNAGGVFPSGGSGVCERCSGVLEEISGDTVRRAAVSPLSGGGCEREALLEVARCVAECAMALGEGTGIYQGNGQHP